MTRREIEKKFNQVIAIGYCGAQHLLQGKVRIGYNSGIYGWNYDIYQIGNTAICTGYRGMPGIIAALGIVKEYDTAAFGVWENSTLTDNQKQDQVDRLLIEFVNKITA